MEGTGGGKFKDIEGFMKAKGEAVRRGKLSVGEGIIEFSGPEEK